MVVVDPTEWMVALAVGAGAGWIFTRVSRAVAPRLGLLDVPDGRRKMQARPIPVAGGVAVLLAGLCALAVAAALSPTIRAALTADPQKALALLTAAVVITVVGLIDDRFDLRARRKLLGQLAAALILVGPGGFEIGRLSAFDGVIELGILAVPATLIWLLACTNALNLIDGMDGMLGTVALIALLSFAAIAAMAGQVFPAVIALALAGAVLGFLWFNLPPASVYMGDAGSMLIGLVLGAIAIPASLKGPATVALLAPVAVLILPITDTTAAVIRRKLKGQGLATTDRGHLHHVLQRRGLTTRRALALIAGLGLVAAAGALATTALHNDLFALVAAGGVVVSLVATRLFGHVEVQLVRDRIVVTIRLLVFSKSEATGPLQPSVTPELVPEPATV